MSTEKKTIAQRLEDYQRRYQPAVSRRERLLALREAEQQRLTELQAQALEKFKTSDISELRQMFTKMEEERNQILFDAELELTGIETTLSDIERRLQAASA